MKKMISLFCVIAMLAAFLIPVSAAGFTIAAGDASVKAGEDAVVEVTVSGNPGVAGVLLSISYDSALTLKKVEQGSAFSTMTYTAGGNLAQNPYKVLWDGQDEDTTNGTALKLTFTASKAGDYTVQLSAASGSIYNSSFADVAAEFVAGTIHVTGGSATQEGGSVSGGGQAAPIPEKQDDPQDTTPKPRYQDVAETAWYAEAAAYVTEKGLMSGTGEGIFAPDATMTRAMLMTVLARNAGENTSGGATWYEKGMNWAMANGISDGTNPEGNITREQLVTMLYRYLQKQGGGFTGAWMFQLDYSDSAAISQWAYEPVCWMTLNKVIGGMGDGTLAPQGSATRAQVAAMLMRFLELK